MELPNIVAMYRIKNEERWLKKSLEFASQICNEIVVLDDGSTDNSQKICQQCPNVVDIQYQNDLPYDESRDRNTILKMALKRKPDFVMVFDGDEILQPNAKKILYQDITILYPDESLYEIQVLQMWDKPNQYRYDGIYGNLWNQRLIRLSKQPNNLHYESTGYPGNGHCPFVPQKTVGWNKSVRLRMKIFHYGGYNNALRQKKYEYYNATQPSVEFDNYIHVIGGKGKLSGPKGMEFKMIPKGIFIEGVS